MFLLIVVGIVLEKLLVWVGVDVECLIVIVLFVIIIYGELEGNLLIGLW